MEESYGKVTLGKVSLIEYQYNKEFYKGLLVPSSPTNEFVEASYFGLKSRRANSKYGGEADQANNQLCQYICHQPPACIFTFAIYKLLSWNLAQMFGHDRSLKHGKTKLKRVLMLVLLQMNRRANIAALIKNTKKVQSLIFTCNLCLQYTQQYINYFIVTNIKQTIILNLKW